MRYCISQNSIRKLRMLIEESNPILGIAEATEEFKVGVRTTKLVIQRNTIEKMMKTGVASKEIINRARGNIGDRRLGLSSKALRKEINRLLRYRLVNKLKEMKKSQNEWWGLQAQAERKLPWGSRDRYKQIRREEMSRVWDIHWKSAQDKLTRLARSG